MTKNLNLKPIPIGEVFGKLTVLEYHGKRCKCRCECGKEIVVISTKLRTGHTKSCGCLKRQTNKDTAKTIPVGTKFGRLTLVSQDGSFGEFECECGNKITLKTIKVRSGHTRSCGCLVSDMAIDSVWHMRKFLSSDTEHLEPKERAFYMVENYYRRQAEERSAKWEISEQEFRTLTKQNCFYCGAAPSNEKTSVQGKPGYTYNGIDRLDGTGPYSASNLTACCASCANAKGTLSKAKFMESLRKECS